ncbi:MAG: hypothetical protein ACRENX_01550 [Candidatus Dormibacteria bacterium]
MGSWQEGEDRRLEEGRQWAPWALEQWATFPTTGKRPLVLTGPMVWSQGGHRPGPAKLAFLNRDWELPPAVPAAVLELAKATAGHTPIGNRSYEPLHIQSASLARAAFETDRGPVQLPAWRLESDQALGPMWVLDPKVASTVWAPPKITSSPPELPRPTELLEEATIVGGDGTRLRVTFTGGSPRGVDYPSAEVFESEHAVVILPVAIDTGPEGFRTLQGYSREVVGKLSRPIGDRVLVNLDASPVAALGP